MCLRLSCPVGACHYLGLGTPKLHSFDPSFLDGHEEAFANHIICRACTCGGHQLYERPIGRKGLSQHWEDLQLLGWKGRGCCLQVIYGAVMLQWHLLYLCQPLLICLISFLILTVFICEGTVTQGTHAANVTPFFSLSKK